MPALPGRSKVDSISALKLAKPVWVLNAPAPGDGGTREAVLKIRQQPKRNVAYLLTSCEHSYPDLREARLAGRPSGNEMNSLVNRLQ